MPSPSTPKAMAVPSGNVDAAVSTVESVAELQSASAQWATLMKVPAC